MNYSKRVYLNWFILGLTVGLVPYVLNLARNATYVEIHPAIYLFLLAVPTVGIQAFRKLYEVL